MAVIEIAIFHVERWAEVARNEPLNYPRDLSRLRRGAASIVVDEIERSPDKTRFSQRWPAIREPISQVRRSAYLVDCTIGEQNCSIIFAIFVCFKKDKDEVRPSYRCP